MYHNATSITTPSHHDNVTCTVCHPHSKGFPSFTTVFNPVKRWFVGLLVADSAYAKPPAWAQDGALPPGLANHSLPEQAWANGLKRFRLSYEIVRKAAVQENNGQAAIKDDIILYYHNDHLGTPCFLTDEVGSIVWRREQTPFGETSFERGTTMENLRFPGQYWDEEKQSSYNFYRDSYVPSLGRYGQADLIGLDGGINLYVYVTGNPINLIDIYGERVSVFTRSLDIPILDTYPYVHCVLTVEDDCGKKTTWDFQKDNKVYSPAKSTVYPVRHPKTTIVYDNFDKDDLVGKFANSMKSPVAHPYYDIYNYNCCHWVEDVLSKSGVSWRNPNPWPYN